MTDSRKELLFYDAYEAFYAMADRSMAFHSFCKEAFGEDFSQDGFSDIAQINMLFAYTQLDASSRILDIGCGNGKMLGYLQKKTGAHISGFDYSEKAIQTARSRYSTNADFRVGVIGETAYPAEQFDLITAMDTMYFASSMTDFVAQIKRWLKPNGIFFAGYQEGDVLPRTQTLRTAELTKALEANQMPFEAIDITQQTYDLLRRKRQAALHHKAALEAEGNREWFDLLMLQTEYANTSFESFQKAMARYLFIARKH